MSRRIVEDLETGKPAVKQRGYVYQKGKRKTDPWNPSQATYGRYRVDVPGERGQKEVRVALGRCRDEMEAVLRLNTKMEDAGVLSVEKIRERIGPNSTFCSQSAWWLDELRAGNIVSKKSGLPVQPTTVSIYETGANYLNGTFIADLPLASIDNPEAKRLIRIMVDDQKKGRFSDSNKTIREYFQVLQLVIASAVDERTGKPVHPREWNRQFICLPKSQKQSRPKLSRKDLEFLIQNAEPRHAVLYSFFAGSGVRRSEGLGLEVKHLSKDCSTVTICQQRVRGGGVKAVLKTDAAYRVVALHPDLAKMLNVFVGNRTEGYLFYPTKIGRQNKQKDVNNPMFITVDPANVQRDSLNDLMLKLGRGQVAGEAFHMLRRFRKSQLIRAGIDPLVRNFWFGHADKSMDRVYAEELLGDTEWLKEQAEHASLGFDIPASLFGLHGLQNPIRKEEEIAA
jgi:integrase